MRGVRNRLAWERGVLLDDALNPGAISARHARLQEPHVRALNAWANGLAAAESRRVPWFDPASGGVAARVLVLMQDPSSVAAHGSRLISRHNNDQTAHNLMRVAEAAGLGYESSVHWNVVPWWVTDPAIPPGERIGLRRAAQRARPHLAELLALLPDLTVVVLLGRPARESWTASGLRPAGVDVITAPHPSPQAFHALDRQTGRRNGDLVMDALTRAAIAVR